MQERKFRVLCLQSSLHQIREVAQPTPVVNFFDFVAYQKLILERTLARLLISLTPSTNPSDMLLQQADLNRVFVETLASLSESK